MVSRGPFSRKIGTSRCVCCISDFDRLSLQIHILHLMFQLKVLRQLVELQLEHNAEIKSTIDVAWGVQHNKHKKKEAQDAPPDPSDPRSKERLQLIPIGQDTQRKRYWVVDGPCTVFSYHISVFARIWVLLLPNFFSTCRRPPSGSYCVFVPPLTFLLLWFRFTAHIRINKSLEDGGYISDRFLGTGRVYCHH